MLLKQFTAGVLSKKAFTKASHKLDERAKLLEDEAGANGSTSAIEISSSSSDEDTDDEAD